MAQHSQQRPSLILQIEAFVQRKYGLDGWWTAIQLDHAVYTFGSRIDALLNEIDDKGKPKHSLDSLLKRRPAQPVNGVAITRLSRSDGRIQPRPQMRKA